MNIEKAMWISTERNAEGACFSFYKDFNSDGEIKSATLEVSALGVYKARINGKTVGDFILAPGWTVYRKRVQYQTYDVTDMLEADNRISVTVGVGWRFHVKENDKPLGLDYGEYAFICALTLKYADGSTRVISTDESWLSGETNVRYSNIYNGDIVDMTYECKEDLPVRKVSEDTSALIPQQGEEVREQEVLPVKELIITPKGETVLDFGQNLTGYPVFRIKGKKYDRAVIKCAEVLDRDGNFYTDNYRKAKSEIAFICDGNEHTYKPEFSFYGFRYLRLDGFTDEINTDDFKAVVVHSEMKRTGSFECSDEDVNKLYHNIIWGQKGNFLDVPTDCPQRDERLGWTGDAQVFALCATYNYDTKKFYDKWLSDLEADQFENGAVPCFIPLAFRMGMRGSSAWGDAATVIPWVLYMMYGNTDILEKQFDSMRRWVDFTYECEDVYFNHKNIFGDWLATDNGPDSCAGATDKSYISYAFRYYSTGLLIKSARLINADFDYEKYEKRLKETQNAVIQLYYDGLELKIRTQTACVLSLQFGLYPEAKANDTELLCRLIEENDGKLTTGFVGTPYLLHVLSESGHTDIAYSLLFEHRCPSWLYSVDHGATTMWEHWNGIKEDGSMWSDSMNSFNHYAYGAVGDWLYGVCAGIRYDEEKPGFKHIIFKPRTTERMTYLKASYNSCMGLIRSSWVREEDGKTTYSFTVPQGSYADAYIGNEHFALASGEHTIRV